MKTDKVSKINLCWVIWVCWLLDDGHLTMGTKYCEICHLLAYSHEMRTIKIVLQLKYFNILKRVKAYNSHFWTFMLHLRAIDGLLDLNAFPRMEFKVGNWKHEQDLRICIRVIVWQSTWRNDRHTFCYVSKLVLRLVNIFKLIRPGLATKSIFDQIVFVLCRQT